MDHPKYNGNIHPDEWISDTQKYFKLRKIDKDDFLEAAISLVDSTILLPNGIDSFEKLRNALKEDIAFVSFKNTNKRMLDSLKYIPGNGKTSEFISIFRKLCYNAEINDVNEQYRYFYKSLPNQDVLFELIKRKEKINSMDDMFREFEKITTVKSEEKVNLIRNSSVVALKHVATGRYLSSTDLCYATGSKQQLVFAGSPELDFNSLWSITFGKEFIAYGDSFINLQHIKTDANSLGIFYCAKHVKRSYNKYEYYKSPSTEHTEVCCSRSSLWPSWKFHHSKLENPQGYLKSNDTINLRMNVKESDGNYVTSTLRSHDVQFTVGNDTFQEVFCHNERLGGNDEWCIELIY